MKRACRPGVQAAAGGGIDIDVKPKSVLRVVKPVIGGIVEGTGYFFRVKELTPTRFWINNPTIEEARVAIESGAVSCTTNPTYAMKQLKSKTDALAARSILREAVDRHQDDDEAADWIQQQLVKRIADLFLPVFEASAGQAGFVSIQGNPYLNRQAEHIVEESLRYRQLGPNIIAKIPVTEAGLAALGRVLAEGMAVIATEVMGLSQAAAACDTYARATRDARRKPPFFLTHITGIFDEYLQQTVRQQGIEISPDLLWHAGLLVAKKQHRMFRERGYFGTMLGGGARGLHHFTEFVGLDMHITINWAGSAERLLAEDGPVVWRTGIDVPEEAIAELLGKVVDFGRAWDEDAMDVGQFESYGPVVHFRNSFVEGWDFLRSAVAETRRQ